MATPSPRTVRSLALLLTTALMLSACAYARPNPTPPYFTGQYGPGDPTVNRVGGPEGLSLTFDTNPNGVEPSGPEFGVNPFLWRGALDTLSSLPLTSAEPLGGIIITDWYSQPGDPGERFKTTAYMEGPELHGSAVRVTVFRQVNRGGRWVDVAANPAMQTELQNRILERTRQLWQQATGQG
ncbi:MAG: DUF3576 domain-containing protein [Acetobacteraceae bacterium]|jgi:hypothetical protein